jgi:integrase/recombinase XerD
LVYICPGCLSSEEGRRVGAKVTTTLKKIESMRNKQNREFLKEFYRYRQSLDHTSDLATNNILTLLIYLDKFLNGHCSFLDILQNSQNKSKEQIINFLEHRFVLQKVNKNISQNLRKDVLQKEKSLVEGSWVKREHDTEGKWITTWNQYGIWLKTFFRWLANKDEEDESNWETPSFLQKIKSKKPLRDSPYEDSEIWERDEILRIVKYTDTRDQAIITLMWDLDARNREITELRICDILLKEQYGQGTIPSNTKTGGGPILLRCSIPYVRDWINKHPFRTEPKAKLICSSRNGAPIRPDAIQKVMKRLRLHIKRIVESGGGDGNGKEEKEKLEYLLRTKKWNPYCIRHSAIDADAAYLPEHALKKRVRWSMNSKQAVRYVRRRMNDELTNKILEHDGIRFDKKATEHLTSNIICMRCNYVNKLGSKYCEGKGCNSPLTQLALDEIKAAEQTKMQELINKSNLERDNTIQALRQEMRDIIESYKKSTELSVKQNNMITEVMSKYDGLIGEYERLTGLFDKSVSFAKTKTANDELESIMKDGGVLIKPGRRTAEELQRRAKILLQVAPDWQKRTAPVNVRLTPEEERKVMELINQPDQIFE